MGLGGWPRGGDYGLGGRVFIVYQCYDLLFFYFIF